METEDWRLDVLALWVGANEDGDSRSGDSSKFTLDSE